MKFDKIYVISLLQKRPKKLTEFMDRLPKDWDLGKIDVLNAVDGRAMELPEWWNQKFFGSYGCYLSHKILLELIVQNRCNNVLIFEDDAVFCENFIDKLKNLWNYLPEDWDQLYLGGQHLGQYSVVNHYILKGTNINRTHCYAIKNDDVAKKIIDHISEKQFWKDNLTERRCHIDYAYGILHQKNIINAYASRPWLVGQAPTNFSDTGSQSSVKTRWWN